MRRIEKYLHGVEVSPVPPLDGTPHPVAMQSATVTWPQDRTRSSSAASSVSSTPKHKFILMDLSLDFPLGELSLICGKLGSGKSLMLLALLGEADVLAGQIISPRSPPDTIASFVGQVVSDEEWTVQGVCAYVPQVSVCARFWISFLDPRCLQSAWLRNASIRGKSSLHSDAVGRNCSPIVQRTSCSIFHSYPSVTRRLWRRVSD